MPAASALAIALEDAFHRRLSEAWPTLVDCPTRLRTLGPFLRREGRLKSGLRVLDAAAGIGCEAQFLARNGCHVVANEIANEFRTGLTDLAKEAHFEVSGVDWRNLKAAYGSDAFDLIVLLGNSIALILEPHVRRDIIAQLFAVCRPGGRVIIDQRNFDRIVADRAAYLGGQTSFNRKTIYCGEVVHAVPLRIEADVIDMGYFVQGGVAPIGDLEMSTLSKDWLGKSLRTAGFRTQAFYDLGLSDPADADFITFVAERPGPTGPLRTV